MIAKQASQMPDVVPLRPRPSFSPTMRPHQAHSTFMAALLFMMVASLGRGTILESRESSERNAG